MNALHTCLVAWTLALGQADAASPVALTSAEITQAIEELAHPEFELRQRATNLLFRAGKDARPALERAAKSSIREVRSRAQSILNDFEYGIYADTPPDVAQRVRRFRQTDEADQKLIWNELVKDAPIETLLAILRVRPDSSRQRMLLERLESSGEVAQALSLAETWRDAYVDAREVAKFDEFIAKHVPHLLAAKEFDKAEGVLSRMATTDKGIRDWSVYLLLQGELDAKIEEVRARCRALTETPAGEADDQFVPRLRHEDERNHELTRLALMLRVKGDLEGARDAAGQIHDPSMRLLRSILFDLRDWRELAERQRELAASYSNSVENLGFAAAYHRLAGNDAAFHDAIASIRRWSDNASGQTLGHCREALFLNGFTDAAIELLRREDPVEAFQIQVVRQQYVAAFEAAGIGTTHESREEWLQQVVKIAPDRSTEANRQFQIAVQVAQILRGAGEPDEATTMFERLAAAIVNDRDGMRLRQLAKAELASGMTNEAFEHGTRALLLDGNVAAIELLFPRHSALAKAWWEILERQSPDESAHTRVPKLRKLFYRGEVDQELLELLDSAVEFVLSLERPGHKRVAWTVAVGDTCSLRQQSELANRCFDAVADESEEITMRRADAAAKGEKWSEAASLYGQAWEMSEKPLALYLSGQMKIKAGDPDGGQDAVELARLIPLASASRHESFAFGLTQRGYREEALQQWDLLRRCSTWTEAQMFHAIAGLGDAVAAADPLQAAAYWEQRMLNCLQENWFFTDVSSYIRIPHLVHQTRGRALLDRGDVALASKELRLCQQIWPGQTDLVESTVAKLDEAGESPFAEQLFEEAFAKLERTCELFPNSAMHHNNLAWTAARSGRRLDEALAHVTRSLELAPESAQYLDTLAEVHFRRGDVDLAIEYAKRCIELAPDEEFFRQQLARFLDAKQQPQ